MSNLQNAVFFTESFTYHGNSFPDARRRPTIAVGLLRSGTPQAARCIPPAERNVNSTSLAMLGARKDLDDNRDNDYFLPQFDHGHLFGAQYGGSEDSYNLVPMLRRTNRGGDWAKFEAAIMQTMTPAILVMRCRYSVVDDPRIPSSVEAALIPINGESSNKIGDAWGDWCRNLGAIVKNAPPGMLGQRVSSQLRPAISTNEANVKRASFTQEPYQFVWPSHRLLDWNGFASRVEQAILYINRTGWTVEKDERAGQTRSKPPVQENFQFVPHFALPSPTNRPYAALDYLALDNHLDGLLEGGDNNQLNIANSKILTAATFSAEMKSFAKYMNLMVNQKKLTSQLIYLSDAAAHPIYPDLGPGGDGLMMDPEFDHIIPRERSTFLGWPGPTMFSNLQLISPIYNSRKSNRPWAESGVEVGEIRPVINVTRGAKRRATAEGDPARLRHKK